MQLDKTFIAPTVCPRMSRKHARLARLRANLLTKFLKIPTLTLTVRKNATTRRWVVDSGSCFDIVGKLSLSDSDQTRIRHSKNGVILQTANGVINETRTVDISVDCIDKTIEAVVLDQCPNILSLGHRCMIEGYSFRWDAGQNPVLIKPDGREIVLELEWLVPVLPVISGACGTEEFEAAQALEPGGTLDQAATEPPPPLPPPSGIAREKPPSTHELFSTCKICFEAKLQRAPCHKKRESAEA